MRRISAARVHRRSVLLCAQRRRFLEDSLFTFEKHERKEIGEAVMKANWTAAAANTGEHHDLGEQKQLVALAQRKIDAWIDGSRNASSSPDSTTAPHTEAPHASPPSESSAATKQSASTRAAAPSTKTAAALAQRKQRRRTAAEVKEELEHAQEQERKEQGLLGKLPPQLVPYAAVLDFALPDLLRAIAHDVVEGLLAHKKSEDLSEGLVRKNLARHDRDTAKATVDAARADVEQHEKTMPVRGRLPDTASPEFPLWVAEKERLTDRFRSAVVTKAIVDQCMAYQDLKLERMRSKSQFYQLAVAGGKYGWTVVSCLALVGLYIYQVVLYCRGRSVQQRFDSINAELAEHRALLLRLQECEEGNAAERSRLMALLVDPSKAAIKRAGSAAVGVAKHSADSIVHVSSNFSKASAHVSETTEPSTERPSGAHGAGAEDDARATQAPARDGKDAKHSGSDCIASVVSTHVLSDAAAPHAETAQAPVSSCLEIATDVRTQLPSSAPASALGTPNPLLLVACASAAGAVGGGVAVGVAVALLGRKQ